ncbi:EthD family reductase [Candidatus Binatus sp.]|uniref:EthD family reductase n=1 Tax=Candidatus Binatus sp. TaxID=2811406 RepID=UPI003BAEE8EB
MHLTFVTFNFQSADIAAEESNYLGHHVDLARRFPGLRQYYTGRLMKVAGKESDRVRAAILAYDDAAAAASAMRSDVVPALLADTQAHLKDVTSTAVEAETVVPFDSRRAGQNCFVMVAEFDLVQGAGLDAAEKHYLGTHVNIARRLPGLRNYIIGKLIKTPGIEDSRYRMATLAFDSLEAYRAAYRSAAGRELLKDEEATIRNARVYRLDARVEV